MTFRPKLAQVIAEKTLRTSDTAALTREVAAYLIDQNHVDQLDSVMRDVLKYRAEHGHVEATVVSAFPLGTAERSAIMAELKAEYPKASSYTLNQRVDENVVGGIRMEMAGEQLDLTVRAKLNTLKRLTAARN